MKKLILAGSILCSLHAYSQNTIPTTTVTGALKVNDSLRVNKTITAKGEVIVKDTLRAKKDVLVDGNVNIDGKLKVQGNVKFKDDAKFEKGFTFDGTNGISKVNTLGNLTFRYGNGTAAKTTAVCAAAKVASLPGTLIHEFDGTLQVFDAATNGAGGLLNIQTWTGGSSIDASAGGQTGSGRLLINYFCGNDTYINTGPNEGIVNLGVTHIGKANLTSASPHFTDAKLTVAGKVVAQSCYVTQSNWADFVFAKDYKLPKLSDIETYYKENGHLPQIPTAKEVKENGVDLGEMNKLLLQKIEELTILMVEQDKRIKQLETKK